MIHTCLLRICKSQITNEEKFDVILSDASWYQLLTNSIEIHALSGRISEPDNCLWKFILTKTCSSTYVFQEAMGWITSRIFLLGSRAQWWGGGTSQRTNFQLALPRQVDWLDLWGYRVFPLQDVVWWLDFRSKFSSIHGFVNQLVTSGKSLQHVSLQFHFLPAVSSDLLDQILPVLPSKIQVSLSQSSTIHGILFAKTLLPWPAPALFHPLQVR